MGLRPGVTLAALGMGIMGFWEHWDQDIGTRRDTMVIARWEQGSAGSTGNGDNVCTGMKLVRTVGALR